VTLAARTLHGHQIDIAVGCLNLGTWPSTDVSSPLTNVSLSLTLCVVIRTFRSKALADLWSKGRTAKIDAKMHKRILIRLDRLNAATAPEQMNLPGFDFHVLKGLVPIRYTVHVNGPWCITFEMDSGDAFRVDFEQCH
jgi:toxin HigB-1